MQVPFHIGVFTFMPNVYIEPCMCGFIKKKQQQCNVWLKWQWFVLYMATWLLLVTVNEMIPVQEVLICYVEFWHYIQYTTFVTEGMIIMCHLDYTFSYLLKPRRQWRCVPLLRRLYRGVFHGELNKRTGVPRGGQSCQDLHESTI